MFACQPQLVAEAILCDVLYMCLCKLVNGRVDDVNASIFTHALCGVVGVSASPWVLVTMSNLIANAAMLANTHQASSLISTPF